MYNISGILEIFSFIIWSSNLFIATIMLIGNPKNFFLRFFKMHLILLSIIWILITYNVSGFYLTLPLILAILNVGISTFLLIFSADSFKLKFIRVISILYIIIIILIQLKPLIDFLLECLKQI
jgi:hypothetical protein